MLTYNYLNIYIIKVFEYVQHIAENVYPKFTVSWLVLDGSWFYLSILAILSLAVICMGIAWCWTIRIMRDKYARIRHNMDNMRLALWDEMNLVKQLLSQHVLQTLATAAHR